MPQQILQTERITLVPLADEHLEWEVELDSDPEVMRYLSGRASTREEVVASHARRMAAAQKVDGLGFWVGLSRRRVRRLVDPSARPRSRPARRSRRIRPGLPAAATSLAQGLGL
jgi:hypothetical protein